MTNREEFNHEVRLTAILTVALTAALVFGIVVLASGDWIPGAVIVAATLVGLTREIPVIRKLCSTEFRPSPPKNEPVS